MNTDLDRDNVFYAALTACIDFLEHAFHAVIRSFGLRISYRKRLGNAAPAKCDSCEIRRSVKHGFSIIILFKMFFCRVRNVTVVLRIGRRIARPGAVVILDIRQFVGILFLDFNIIFHRQCLGHGLVRILDIHRFCIFCQGSVIIHHDAGHIVFEVFTRRRLQDNSIFTAYCFIGHSEFFCCAVSPLPGPLLSHIPVYKEVRRSKINITNNTYLEFLCVFISLIRSVAGSESCRAIAQHGIVIICNILEVWG